MDYNIWKETVESTKCSHKIQLELKHVKGHQQEVLHNVKKEQGPLTQQATYNDWCDIEAD